MSDPNLAKDSHSPSTATSGSAGQKSDQRSRDPKKAKDRFRYGNYNRYYGTRTKGFEQDPRLALFRPEWFRARRVLDIGCNVGHLTLAIAKQFGPAYILGIDIDEHLVGVARKNIRHYCKEEHEFIGKFPASIAPEDQQGSSEAAVPYEQFPKNVWFLRENYVLESDDFLEMVREEYDLVLALSITKWVHLNWGDAGLKRFLRRTFLQLRPGGRLLLEAQPFSKYYKSAKAMPDLFNTYKAIQFRPDQLQEWLLSEEVGFARCTELGTPQAISEGFQRPILMFEKPVKRNNRKPGAKSATNLQMMTEPEKDNLAKRARLDSSTPVGEVPELTGDEQLSIN